MAMKHPLGGHLVVLCAAQPPSLCVCVCVCVWFSEYYSNTTIFIQLCILQSSFPYTPQPAHISHTYTHLRDKRTRGVPHTLLSCTYSLPSLHKQKFAPTCALSSSGRGVLTCSPPCACVPITASSSPASVFTPSAPPPEPPSTAGLGALRFLPAACEGAGCDTAGAAAAAAVGGGCTCHGRAVREGGLLEEAPPGAAAAAAAVAVTALGAG